MLKTMFKRKKHYYDTRLRDTYVKGFWFGAWMGMMTTAIIGLLIVIALL